MNGLEPRFEWDESKAERNQKKHGISFDEAMTVFRDPFGIVVPDVDHSSIEERWLLIGLSTRPNLIVVVFKDEPSGVRIISAHRPTRRQVSEYEEGSGSGSSRR